MRRLTPAIVLFMLIGMTGIAQQRAPVTSPEYASRWDHNLKPAFYNEVIDELDLPALHRGADSVAFRIWATAESGTSLFNYRYSKGTTTASAYAYANSIETLHKVLFKPRMTPADFLTQLARIDFTAMATAGGQHAAPLDGDERVYTVEIARPGSYHILTFHSGASENDPQQKEAAKFITLAERYFRIP